jgi:hypothetical protein
MNIKKRNRNSPVNVFARKSCRKRYRISQCWVVMRNRPSASADVDEVNRTEGKVETLARI